jgi:hypothetical protein
MRALRRGRTGAVYAPGSAFIGEDETAGVQVRDFQAQDFPRQQENGVQIVWGYLPLIAYLESRFARVESRRLAFASLRACELGRAGQAGG